VLESRVSAETYPNTHIFHSVLNNGVEWER
jgi:hypothetical protein